MYIVLHRMADRPALSLKMRIFRFNCDRSENPIIFRPDFRFESNYTNRTTIKRPRIRMYEMCYVIFYFNDHDDYRSCRHGRRTRTTGPLKKRACACTPKYYLLS
jgi:hypothetical protein